MEPDCPPFLNGFRGIEEGIGPLLSLLKEEKVKTTFFSTGQVAKKYPRTIRDIVSSGHELGCHGESHRDFCTMDHETAEAEIEDASGVLRQFAPVTSFRAPYLKFPEIYLTLLEAHGFLLDSSQAKYKVSYYRKSISTKLKRIPVSVTSSVLRLPPWIRTPYLGALSSPIVLFVHPWEFVDWRKEKLRLDCRFKTGVLALDCLRSVIRFYAGKNAVFLRMEELHD